MDQIKNFVGPYVGKASTVFFQYDLPRGFIFQFSYFQAGLTALLIFLLILTLGQLRHRFVSWQASGVMPGIMFGFTIALILEGILILAGRTILTEVLGWKDAPKPISNALDAGRKQMVHVLGVTDQIPSSMASETPTVGKMMSLYNEMDQQDKESLQSIVCEN